MFLIPTLLSAAGSLFGANARKQTAASNFAISSANAQTTLSADMASLSLQSMANQTAFGQASLNAQLAEQDAQMRTENAERLRTFATARTKTGREAARRQRRRFDRFQSTQQAGYAASGVTSSGSALDVLAETAGEIQLAMQDQADAIHFERDSTLNQAADEDFAGRRGSLAAKYDLVGAKSSYNLNQAANAMGRVNALARFNSNIFGAQSTQIAQQQQAGAQAFSTLGTIFAGIGQARDRRDQSRYLGIGTPQYRATPIPRAIPIFR